MELTDAQKQYIVQIGRNVSDTCDWYMKMCYGVETDKKPKDMGLYDTTIDETRKYPMIPSECYKVPVMSRKEAMQIASTLPNSNLAELIDNTERIMKYLEERV